MNVFEKFVWFMSPVIVVWTRLGGGPLPGLSGQLHGRLSVLDLSELRSTVEDCRWGGNTPRCHALARASGLLSWLSDPRRCGGRCHCSIFPIAPSIDGKLELYFCAEPGIC